MTTLRLVAPPSSLEDGARVAASGKPNALGSLAALLDTPELHVPPVPVSLLRDLACALVELAGGRERVSVLLQGRPRRPGAAWQIGLERDAERLAVSLFRHGRVPEVAQSGRSVLFAEAREAVAAAIDALVACEAAAAADRGLALAREELERVRLSDDADARWRTIALEHGAPARLRVEARLRLRAPAQPTETAVARSDLLPLLFRGSIEARVGRARARVEQAHAYLLCEQLVELCIKAQEAQGEGRLMLRRVAVGGIHCGLRVDRGGRASLLLGDAEPRLPPVECGLVCRTVAGFTRALCGALLEVDPSQRCNLRLTALLERLGDLERALAEPEAAGPLGGAELRGIPESYRAFAESAAPASGTARAESVGKLRFIESWRAEVPGIDLRSTLLFGERLIVGALQELACIERTTGRLAWTRRARRAVSIPTPLGLARLAADGRLALLDCNDGRPMFELTLAPCVGATTSGAVINAAGLPHLLLVAEGAEHLTAIDLDACEVRWRRVVDRPFKLRLRRAGKLVIASGGDALLSALDLVTGELVWQRRGTHGYAHPVALDGGQLYALGSAESRRAAPLFEHIDPWTGEVRWRAPLPAGVAVQGAPLCGRDMVLLTTREDRGLGVIAFHRESGELAYHRREGLCGGRASCVMVDELLIANARSGELVALDARDGSLRYRHVLAAWRRRGGNEGPRSLRPVLRSGALFVPQSDVCVVRPRDGAVLGRLGGDLIPDALVVDERCGVYVAEASGYLTAYQAQPMLTLVRRA